MRLKILLGAVAFLVLPFIAAAQDNKEMLIQELYSKSGLEKQIGQLPMAIQAGFDQAVAADDNLKVIPRNVIGQIRASIKRVFAQENIKKAIWVECREKLSIGDLEKVLGWLDSPIGRKLTRLEEAASTPEQYAAMQRFAMQLEESPPLPERLDIIRQLDSAVKATETGVEVAMNTQLAIAIAIVASLPREQQPTYDSLVGMIEQTRSQIENVMRTQTLLSFLYVYSSVTHRELGQYIAFASSPAGTNYHDATLSGLKKALLEGSYKWGEFIADILKHSESKTEA